MEISINANNLDALAFACANGGLKYYTVPTTKPDLVRAFVKNHNGSDITNIQAWYLCDVMNAKINSDEASREAAEYYRKLIYHPAESVSVQPIDVLP